MCVHLSNLFETSDLRRFGCAINCKSIHFTRSKAVLLGNVTDRMSRRKATC